MTPTDDEKIDQLISEAADKATDAILDTLVADDIPVIDASKLDDTPPNDGRFDTLYMNNEGTMVVVLGDGKTGFQNQFTVDGEAASLALVRFTSTHIENDVTEEDHKTATKPFLRLDFDNERALDSLIAVANTLKQRWTERKAAREISLAFEESLKTQILQKCSHDPTQTNGAIGMYHCPDCGEMVIAGVAHPPDGGAE